MSGDLWKFHDVGKRSMIVSEDGFTIIDACLTPGTARCIVNAHNATVARLSAPAPAAERVTYFVSATYATPSGRMAHWSGRMASASGDILADAERLIRKYRRVAGKLDIRAAAI